MNGLWLLTYLVIERFFELALSTRNKNTLFKKGGREHSPESYYELVVLHTSFLVSLTIESYPWLLSIDPRTVVLFGSFVLLQCARYWCMWALGVYWNARIIVVPGKLPRRRGPYRYFRHPNYLVVSLEFLVIPLLLEAPLTLIIFFVANLVLIQKRIRLEEKALEKETDYKEVFNKRPLQ